MNSQDLIEQVNNSNLLELRQMAIATPVLSKFGSREAFQTRQHELIQEASALDLLEVVLEHPEVLSDADIKELISDRQNYLTHHS